ncbi:ATP-binding protein, partial [Pseudomonas viridiflava]|uniref:ATP-binding protein n=1 Tax=Pseudomonas viridiflava TaxID=33069 RepID=UPI0030B9ED5F
MEPFYSTKGVGKGTGLGLPMVQGLALQSGGEFDIRSKPGQGTEVTLWLPVATVRSCRQNPGRRRLRCSRVPSMCCWSMTKTWSGT